MRLEETNIKGQDWELKLVAETDSDRELIARMGTMKLQIAHLVRTAGDKRPAFLRIKAIEYIRCENCSKIKSSRYLII